MTKLYTQQTIYSRGASFNDSESLAIELALLIEGKTKEITCNGSIAFVVLQVDRKTQKAKAMYYGRNYGSPLIIEKDKKFFTLKSEGTGKSVRANYLYRYSLFKGTVSAVKMLFGSLYSEIATKLEKYDWTDDYNRTKSMGYDGYPTADEDYIEDLRDERKNYCRMLTIASEKGDNMQIEEAEALIDNIDG